MLKYFSILIVLVVLFGCQNVSNPNQEVPDVQPDLKEVITDKTPFIDVPPDVTPAANEVVILQRSTVSDESQVSTSAGIETNKIIGEVGKLLVRQGKSNRWHKISFLNEFRNPVVIMQPLSYNFGDPAVIRIKNVTTLDFEFQIDEWNYLDGAHGEESVTYLVMESGLWTNGLVYEVGKVRADHNFKKVNLNYPFPTGAVILTQAQSRNDAAAVTTRQQLATGGFRVKVQEEEKADGTHPVEDIGYIVILPGEGLFGKFQALSAKTGNIVSHNFRTINYSFTAETFGDSYFLAGIQSYAGADTASLRYKRLTNGSVQVRVEEEKSADTETNHPNESVGYLLLRQVDFDFDEDKITASDGEAGDQFGHSVAIDGNTMVVGSPYDDDKGTDAGAAYIYERGAKGKWVKVKKITGFDESAGDLFGWSVAISGNTVVVGAPNHFFSGIKSGTAYIFDRNNGGTNNWGKVQNLIVVDRADEDQFGLSVAISGDTVVVGVPQGATSGLAYIFEPNDSGSRFKWEQVKKLLASDRRIGDFFGVSVAISGDTVVVGAHKNNGFLGAAYIFDRNNGGTNKWEEVEKIIASDGEAGDLFGSSVAISGNTVVVGASSRWNNDISVGSAYIYERNHGGSNKWGQIKETLPSDKVELYNFSHFGNSVAISGDTIVVGNAFLDVDGISSGLTYVYQRNNGGTNQWGQFKKILPSDSATFGNSVAISEHMVLVGAAFDDDNGRNSGSVYVLE